MRISKILSDTNLMKYPNITQKSKSSVDNRFYNSSTLPNVYYINNVNFKSIYKAEKTVPDIEFEEYKRMQEHTKERYRRIYKSFQINKSINKQDLFDPKEISLPLQSEEKLEKFFDISKEYLKYKDHPIICLGRSPK